MGMIACAGACVSLSAFGNTNADWFSASASGTTASLSDVAASGTYTVEGGKFAVDNDSSTALVFTPDPSITATNMSDGVVTIVAAAELTPSSAGELDSNVATGAKAGLAVGIDNNVTNYYGYAAAGWKVLSGNGVAVPDSGDTSFKLILDYRNHTVQFFIGNVQMTYGDTTPTTTPAFATGTDSLVDIQAYGSGSVTSIDADYEVAVVAIANGAKYGSLVDAIAAGGTPATIVDVGANGATGTSTAANGLPVAVCKALGISTTETTTPAVAIEPAASDSDASNINFKLADSVTVETGVAVTFAVKKNGTEVDGSPFASNAIKIPLSEGTGVYTIEPAGVQ
jgi:hypothetical protein